MARTLDDLELEPNERAALDELRVRMREHFGGRLVKLVLFGSKAKGEVRRASDIDVMAVIADYDRASDKDATASVRGEIDLEYDVYLELLVYSEKDYEESLGHQWPLFTDVESEGVALHGTVSGRRMPTTPANRRLQAGVLMERARRRLRSAEGMFSLSDLLTAASSEACIAVLRAAQALLTARGSYARRFGEIVTEFDDMFVKAGDFDPRLGKIVNEARRRRIACTYDVTHEEAREAAGAALGTARAFLAAAEKRLKTEIRRLG